MTGLTDYKPGDVFGTYSEEDLAKITSPDFESQQPDQVVLRLDEPRNTSNWFSEQDPTFLGYEFDDSPKTDDKYDLGQVGWANVASTAVSSLFGAIKGVNSAKHANAMAKIQEQVALNNKRMAQLQANAALISANNRISQLTMKYGQLKSRQVTGFAANGIKLSSANVRETLTTTDLHKTMDVNAAYVNGIAAAMGYQNKATQAQMQAIAARNSHSNELEAGVGGLLNAAVKTGTQYWNQKYRYR